MADEDTHLRIIHDLKTDIEGYEQQIERIRREGEVDIRVDETEKQRNPDEAHKWDEAINVKRQEIERQVGSFERQIEAKRSQIQAEARELQREHEHDEKVQGFLRTISRFL